MARSYGAIKVAVWEAGSDFRELTPHAQYGYFLLISQPQLNNLGVLPYTPEKWTRFAAGLTRETLDEALAELDYLHYIVVDTGTAELLVRTFIRHDKVWQQPSLITNARKLIREVESDTIRTLLTARHPWLLTSQPKHEIEEYELTRETQEQSQEKTPLDTPLNTGVETPLGSRAHAGPGAGEGPGVGAAAKPSSTSSTTAASNDEEPELEPLQDPAAAVENPTESDIRAACQRFGADLNVVEPIARQLPGAIFAAVVMKHTVKVARGSAREVPALFVDLLKRELKDQAKAVAKTTRVMPPTRLPEADRPKPATGEDRIRLIVPTLTAHPFERVEETVRTWARAESWTPDELGHRLQLAHTIHGEHHEPDLDHAA